MSFFNQQQVPIEDKSEKEIEIIDSAILMKKIILTGLPGAGKTTIKRLFFENANPLTLLNTSLEPTRGFEADTYEVFNSEIGVFDLAGQENEKWFSNNSDIFSETDVIMVVLEANTHLKDIIEFIQKIIEIKQKKCRDASIYVLVHKIDLIKKYKLFKKVNYLSQFITAKYPNLPNITIFKTSIIRDHFLSTFRSIEKIIKKILNKEIVKISLEQYNDLSLFLQILMDYEYGISYYISDLKFKFKISEEKIDEKLKYMQYLDLIILHEKSENDEKRFELTERADFIGVNIRKMQNSIFQNSIGSILVNSKRRKVEKKAKIDIEKMADTIIRSKISKDIPNIDFGSWEEDENGLDLVPIPKDDPESVVHFITTIKKKEIDKNE